MNLLFFIQIIAESLPISSSGHLVLLNKIITSTVPLTFCETVFAHIPTLIILSCVFFKRFLQWYKYHYYLRIIKDLSVIGLATFITTFSLVISKLLESKILCRIPLWYGFAVTAGLLLYSKSQITVAQHRQFLTFKDGVYLGVAQSIALIPGISRFAITLCTALIIGLEYKYAFMVSAALQALLCAGGAFLFGAIYLFKNDSFTFIFDIKDLLLTILSSLVSCGLFFIVIQYYLKNKFWIIGIYMSLLAFFTLFIF